MFLIFSVAFRLIRYISPFQVTSYTPVAANYE